MTLFFAIWLYPVSTTASRLAGLVMFAVAWFGLIALTWRHRLARFALLGISAMCAVFLLLPARHHTDAASLRSAYVTGLRRYEGVIFYWGGESPKGIDCSGLIRRGLIDSLFLQGIKSFDGGLMRLSLWLWWHDCSARDLRDGHGLTTRLSEASSINALDCSNMLPGDLAVTRDGTHVLAYIGNKHWIEADPGIDRVVTVSVPTENPWFCAPINTVRWNVLR